MKKIYPLPLIAILVCALFWSCEKKGDPPTLPPAESMTIDFSDFAATMKSGLISTDTKDVENTNWTIAATVAGVWNFILINKIAIPVAAFAKAVNTSPAYLDNQTWQWKYSVDFLSSTYTARLTGQVRSNDVKWEMYLSKSGVGAFAEFMWFEGTSASDGKSGSWTIKTGQDDQTPMLKIDWTKSGTGIGTVKYTYIKTGDAFKDSYIEYGLTSGVLDAYYNVYFWETTKVKFTTVNIEWSTSAYNGRVKAPDYFLDSNWYCWDGNGNDVVCPGR